MQAVAPDISKAVDRVWHAGLHELKSYGISDEIFGFISSFLSNRQLQVVLDGKSSQEYPVNFIDGKTQLVLFDLSNNTDAIDMKMYGSVLEEKSCF